MPEINGLDIGHSWEILDHVAHLEGQCHQRIDAQNYAGRKSLGIDPECYPRYEHRQIAGKVGLQKVANPVLKTQICKWFEANTSKFLCKFWKFFKEMRLRPLPAKYSNRRAF